MKRFVTAPLVLAPLFLLVGIAGTLAFLSLAPPPHELERAVETAMAADSAEFIRSMDGLYGADLSDGNAITTLENGDEIFPAMLEAIAGARETITFETYVYWSGEIGIMFAEALSERARAGVEVKVLLDWQGSVPMESELVDQMRAAGATVERFRPIHWYTLDKFNNRTHRKLMIVDGSIAFTGGVGIADEWTGDAQTPDQFRDTHYRIEGPAVASMQGAFAFNWVEATGETLQGTPYFPEREDAGDILAQLVYSHAGSRNVMHLMQMTAIAAARDHIRIATPYFIPDEIAIAQLVDARRRGVEIDILLPGQHTNKKIVSSASRHFWGDLMEAGVRFFAYEPTMYHGKLVVIDDSWASIGSANFDERSFRLNDEANLTVFDEAFAAEQIAMFERDLSQSREISLQEWQSRPFGQKVVDWLWSHLRVQL